MSDDEVLDHVEAAVRSTLSELAVVSPVHGALAETALSLARSLDMRAPMINAQAGMASAALARELRATLEVLAKGVDDDTSESIDQLIAHLSAPVRDSQD